MARDDRERRTEYNQDHGYCMTAGIQLAYPQTSFFSTKFAIARSTISKEKIEGL